MQKVDGKNARVVDEDGEVEQNPPNHVLSADGRAKKNRKKKKNRYKGLSSLSKADGNRDTHLQENSERENLEEIQAKGGDDEIKTGVDRDQLRVGENCAGDYRNLTENVQDSSLEREGGWEVAGTRRSRRKDVQCGQPAYVRSGQYQLNSEGRGKRETDIRKGKEKTVTGGTGSTSFSYNQSCSNRTTKLRQLEKSTVVEEIVPVCESSDVRGAWKGQAISPHSSVAWQPSTNDDVKSTLENCTWGNTRSRLEAPQMLSKLVPHENQGWLGESIYGRRNGGSEQSCTSVPFHPDRSATFDDSPSSPCGDSNCSNGELDDGSDWDASEGFDSDASKLSHETRKKDKRFREFFDTMEALIMDQLNEHDRQWHCPACQGGIGAIDWYRGLQPLLNHATSVRSKRVKLHRNFAKVLEEELKRRGTHAGQSEGMFGKWKGLCGDDETANPFIVWPPAVIIQNTKLELNEQDKWTGMGNKELLDHFKVYNVAKARHAYGPQGHRGISILLFAESPAGYMDAQDLAKCFEFERRGRASWDQTGKVLFYPGGKRMLYGYMASADDMEDFNKHSGKSKIKWSLRRLQEAVKEPMRQMDKDNHHLNLLKQDVEKQKEQSRTLEKTVSSLARKLRLREEEIQIIRQRAYEQHDENQKEMDQLEYLYKAKINQLVNSTTTREEQLQKKEDDFQQEQIELVQQLEKTCADIPKCKEIMDDQLLLQQAKMDEEIARKTDLIEMSLREIEVYESQKRDITREHHTKRVQFMRQQYRQMITFENELEKERMELQERYLHRRQEAELAIRL